LHNRRRSDWGSNYNLFCIGQLLSEVINLIPQGRHFSHLFILFGRGISPLLTSQLCDLLVQIGKLPVFLGRFLGFDSQPFLVLQIRDFYLGDLRDLRDLCLRLSSGFVIAEQSRAQYRHQ
jgi:hypothetical protein